MRHLFAASLLACAFALPAAAQDEGPPVPVDKAAYHVPVFRNEYLTLLRVNIPSKRSGVTRTVRNIGTTRVQLVEIELK
jgi:hypothetical protein